MDENELATIALDIAFEIHREYGPGMFESVYEELFCHKWDKTFIPYKRQDEIPLIHDGVNLGIAFRADIILDDKVILELKSISEILDIHSKQLLTYLKLTELKLGLIINFNAVYLRNGIKRVVNKL